MTVAFSPYELAAYAAGAQIYHLSYEELVPTSVPTGWSCWGWIPVSQIRRDK